MLYYASVVGFVLFIFSFLLVYVLNVRIPFCYEPLCVTKINKTSSIFSEIKGEDVYLTFLSAISGLLAYPANYFSYFVGWTLEENKTIWEDPIYFTKNKNLGNAALRMWWSLSYWGLIIDLLINRGAELERFVADAFFHQRMVIVSLDESKVYVGFVIHPPDPGTNREYLSLLLLHSGYRDSETREVTWSINYSSALYKRLKSGDKGLSEYLSNFEVIVPLEKIQSIHNFTYEGEGELVVNM